MKKAGIIIGVIAVVIIIFVLIVTGGIPSPFPSPSVTFEPITFTGSDMQTTPPFEVTTREWIIDWSYIPDYEYFEYAVFQFFVYPRGETVNFVEAMVSPGGIAGSTYSYMGTGEYYIKVYCGNIESWEITIRPA